ncbi:MAG: alpha/beta hydrolase [Nitrosospira sp.]|nr:alpha/beta hydrolase [Nitrosospira sp.]
MHGWVMKLMGIRLRRCGFAPVVFSYPSMRQSLSQNASVLSRFVAEIPARRLHFFGHSLGGLLILKMLTQFPEQRIGRVILAGSPYNASCIAKKISLRRAGRYILGRSMLQWLNQAEAPIYDKRYELGVIAGDRSVGGGRLIARLPYPNDGVVTVEETRIPGASDEILLNISHSEMLLSSELARQACSFLRNGHFMHNSKPP